MTGFGASELGAEYKRLGLLSPAAAGKKLGINRSALRFLVEQRQLPEVRFDFKGERPRGYRPESLDGKIAVYRDGRLQLRNAP